jgi:hypothetical protein
MYERGAGVTQDVTQAVHWFSKAAEQGLAEAQFSLGMLHLSSENLTQESVNKVIQLFQQAAK